MAGLWLQRPVSAPQSGRRVLHWLLLLDCVTPEPIYLFAFTSSECLENCYANLSCLLWGGGWAGNVEEGGGITVTFRHSTVCRGAPSILLLFILLFLSCHVGISEPRSTQDWRHLIVFLAFFLSQDLRLRGLSEKWGSLSRHRAGSLSSLKLHSCPSWGRWRTPVSSLNVHRTQPGPGHGDFQPSDDRQWGSRGFARQLQ